MFLWVSVECEVFDYLFVMVVLFDMVGFVGDLICVDVSVSYDFEGEIIMF